MPSVATLASTLYVLEQYGPVEPSTLLGPVRQGLGRFGDGLFVEEGTTNLYTNPDFAGTYAGGVAPLWTVAGDGTFTASESNAPTYFGTQAQKITITGAGTYLQVYQTGVTFTANPFSQTAAIWCSRAGLGYSFRNRTSAFNTGAQTLVAGWNLVRASGTPTAGNITSDPYPTIFITGYAPGDVIIVGGAQLEQKAYATSLASGSRATAWNAPGNLLSAAQSSFEDGGTGGGFWQPNGGTIANTTNNPYAGTKALRWTSTSNANGGIYALAASLTGLGLIVGKTYTASTWVTVSNARSGMLAALEGVSSTTFTVTAGVKTRIAQSFVYNGVNAVTFYLLAAQIGDTVDYDAIRIDDGTGSASNRWTGAENASTSTRTAAQLALPMPSTGAGAVTLVAWYKPVAASGPAFRNIANASDGTVNNDVALYLSGSTLTAAKHASGGTVTATSGATVAAGDTVFCAVTYDGSNLRHYTSVNGAAVVSATSGTTTTIPSNATLVTIGTDEVGASPADGVVEQVLVFNRALTSAEVSALAFAGQETAFKDDPGIVIAAGTGIVRGTTKASTTAGSGYYRATRQVSAYVEPVTAIGSNPDDDTATMKATVPAGSGVGQGALVTFAPDGTRYTVQRVFSPGGVNDELWLAAA